MFDLEFPGVEGSERRGFVVFMQKQYRSINLFMLGPVWYSTISASTVSSKRRVSATHEPSLPALGSNHKPTMQRSSGVLSRAKYPPYPNPSYTLTSLFNTQRVINTVKLKLLRVF